MPVAINKVALTDRSLKALKASPDGRYSVWDALMPGLVVRVSRLGKRSFYAARRRTGDRQPTWLQLGVYPAMGLGEAREAAREALTALIEGKHPKRVAEAKRKAAEEAERAAAQHTFRAVAERWLRFSEKRDDAPRASSLRVYNVHLNNALLPALGDRPITEIKREQVIETISAVRDSSGNASARGALAVLTGIFNWALDQGVPGYTASPSAGVRAANIVGRAVKRTRRLSDDELGVIWRALPAVEQPYTTLYKLLLLTGCRVSEVAHARWNELRDGVLEVPAERSKNKLAFVVPLPPRALELISLMPRFVGGDFIFTTTGGLRPVSGSSRAKRKLDAAIKKAGVELPEFVVHDFRRAVRSNLSKLRVAQEVAEACLNHKPAGIVSTYNLYEYLDEKRDALARWEAHLLGIVEPPPADNVVTLPRVTA